MAEYGFQLNTGREVRVDADTLAGAIELAEEGGAYRVLRGRCLEGFDNDAEPGKASWMEGRPVKWK